jgi:hypothetical protein
MLIDNNNSEIWTRTVMELKLSVAIFILFGPFLQCFHLSHIRHWCFMMFTFWDKIFVAVLCLNLF